ncbi:hypothetical protein BJ138DRAFT_1021163 [Hygrophoropsis aurantiaca]|uniref:Uncharacterized protein n=1 Tax=Hygrophoropsis aurantiaca TaxID=72124 RepID=A0ACB7ZQW7_9AGAM|nr:hypothetical protein BJ138DRAFT_1021163 [Hygrophoropsis aurantiaca]
MLRCYFHLDNSCSRYQTLLVRDSGPNICVGYDIKCRFWQILQDSSISTLVKELNMSGVVPGWHGYSHNRYCQITHHSKYKVGAGKEDFETCERTFSESNALAPETRFASEFHRHQAIEEHFLFADEKKYTAILMFIYNNYRQALLAITTCQAFLNAQHGQSGMLAQDYEDDIEAERAFLREAHNKKDEDSIEVEYVQALHELDEAQ